MPIPRLLGAALLVVVLPDSASADLAITWRRTSAGERGVILTERIAGLRQREDQGASATDATFSVIRDLQNTTEILLWHDFKLRETIALQKRPAAAGGDDAESRRLRAIEARVARAVGKPTGRVEAILGVRCREHEYGAASYDSKFVLAGTYWLPDTEAGGDEFVAFYSRLSEMVPVKEASVPRGVRRAMRARLELQREFLAAARRHGIPYRYEYRITGSDSAPIDIRQEARGVSTSPVNPDVFVIPAGYRPR